MSVDVLAFGPHPDDVELFCGGTVLKLVDKGYSVGLVDMTRGEMGTRGTADDRASEAEEAARILGVTFRENLELPDGGLNSREPAHQKAVVEAIRRHTPGLVIGPAAINRHPDHLQGASLVQDAVFLSFVGKYPSDLPRHKVKALMSYPMWWHPEADLIVDVSEVWKRRMEALHAYRTQFHSPGVSGPDTHLASERFTEWVEGRGIQFGAIIGVSRGEPFLLQNAVPVDDPMALLVNGAGIVNV